MNIKPIKILTLTKKNNPEAISVINEISRRENRLPTNAAKTLIVEAGNIKLNHSQEYQNFINQFKNEKVLPTGE